MSGPNLNLSEYFQNDAPSMFDEIVSNTVSTTNTETTSVTPSNTGKWN